MNIKKSKTKQEEQKLGKTKDLEKHRHNTVAIIKNSNATPIRCRVGIAYACCFCAEQFPIPSDLKIHTIEAHDEDSVIEMLKTKNMYNFHVKLDITDLKCSTCKESIETLEQLIDHLKDVHDKKIFTDIKNQIIPFKFENEGEMPKCFLCSSTFYKFKLLLQRMSTHYRNHICEVCGAGFVNQLMLDDHSECHKLGKFNCDFCSKVFNTNKKKVYHEKNTHRESIKHKCGYCNEKFRDYVEKEKHMSELHGHRLSEVKCQVCNEIFSNRRKVNDHMKKLHLTDKRHKCPDCEMTFFTTSDLKRYLVKHYGERKFECKICNKAYARKKTLTQHLRIHSDDRRFKCEYCGQTFVQKCGWRNHMRSRHGEEI